MVMHQIVGNADGKVTLGVRCHVCKQQHVVITTEPGYQRWIDGDYIQRAMPEVKPADRELLISGTCGECWDRMFKSPIFN